MLNPKLIVVIYYMSFSSTLDVKLFDLQPSLIVSTNFFSKIDSKKLKHLNQGGEKKIQKGMNA